MNLKGKNMKKLKIILALIVVILCVGVATRLKDSPLADITSEKSQAIIYFVPVTDYFSSIQNVNTEDVQGRVFYLAEDRDQLGDLIGLDDIAVDSLDQLVQKLDAEQGIGLVRWDRVTPSMKALSYEGKYLYRKADVPGYLLKREAEVSASEMDQASLDPEKLTKINFLGDIMLSRHVNT